MHPLFAVLLIAALVAGATALSIYLLKRSQKREGWINVHGLWVQTDDPLMAEVVAQTWKTEKGAIGIRREDGTLEIREDE